ncbi:UNVERIFIED_CONTAM: Disease resistance response protein [Sesamum radiatum]|uniref:Dirigent protein n=1 Tax=Sesamum radiatum TaxID=300843 RepID=A0AAW2L112_SESRA
MATKTQAAALFLCLLISASSSTAYSRKPRRRSPCRELTFFFHDVLYNGHNYHNATSAIVGSPQWGNKTAVAKPYNFGDVVVFNDPITVDNNFHGAAVAGRRACICTTSGARTARGWGSRFCSTRRSTWGR